MATCQAVFALLPDVTNCSFDQVEAFVNRLLQVTHWCLHADWSNELLMTVMAIEDSFGLAREGYTNKDQAIEAMQRFIDEHFNKEVTGRLHPVRWSF